MSAVRRALGIYEILENVLQYVGKQSDWVKTHQNYVSLVKSRRVCQQWRLVIDSSARLDSLLFRNPRLAIVGDEVAFPDAFALWVEQTVTRCGRTEWYEYNLANLPFVFTWEKFPNIFLTQPATTKIAIGFGSQRLRGVEWANVPFQSFQLAGGSGNWDYHSEEFIWENPRGIRVGEVVEAVRRVVGCLNASKYYYQLHSLEIKAEEVSGDLPVYIDIETASGHEELAMGLRFANSPDEEEEEM